MGIFGNVVTKVKEGSNVQTKIIEIREMREATQTQSSQYTGTHVGTKTAPERTKVFPPTTWDLNHASLDGLSF